MTVRLDFFAWRRSSAFSTVSSPALTPAGRLTGRVPLTLTNPNTPGDTVTENVVFDLLGPGDVEGLKAGIAIRQMVPAPGTVDAENTKCAYVVLAAQDVPWRYTPQLAAGRRLAPWLVLVVGTPQEVTPQPGGTVTISGAALTTHKLVESPRWAHVQDDVDHPGQHFVSRLVSPRQLAGSTGYLAVVVPAFTPAGQPAWTDATPSVTLPLFAAWQFATAEAGDFPTLAARLRPGFVGPTLGKAPLDYAPVPGEEGIVVRGALAPIGSTDADVPAAVAADVTTLTTPLSDPRGRPVISLPAYGGAWVAEPSATTWGAQFRTDPRMRATAGLGLKSGIDEQDKIADAAAAQAGALEEASNRIRALTAGLAAASALWGRRLPADGVRRLAVFGPALRGMQTNSGTVLDRVTGGAGQPRPLPPGVFSAAARRVLRTGPARTRHAAPGASDPRAVLVAANTCPPPPPRAPKGLPHSDYASDVFGVRIIDKALREAVEQGRLPIDLVVENLKRLFEEFDRSPYSDNAVAFFDDVMSQIIERVAAGQPVSLIDVLEVLEPPGGKPLPEEQFLRALRLLLEGQHQEDVDSGHLIDLGETVLTEPADRPCVPVDLDALAEAVGKAIDPTGSPFVIDRVLGTISGLDDQPLTPPELCPDLDLPGWQMLRDHDPNWLLLGAGTMEVDKVVAVSTNPVFTDAYLLGLNTQTLAELRFRNIPVRTGCTPMRQFWSRTDKASDSFVDDIRGVHLWPAASPLGSTAHQTPAASGTDLVVVFRTPLFRRYPHTITYLTPAPLVGGVPDWEAEPDFANRLEPSFQGAITPEIVFFGFDLDPVLGRQYWVVLEEPPHGVQFFSGVHEGLPAAKQQVFTNPLAHLDGAEFADAAFADPYRVMIRGSSLIPEA